MTIPISDVGLDESESHSNLDDEYVSRDYMDERIREVMYRMQQMIDAQNIMLRAFNINMDEQAIATQNAINDINDSLDRMNDRIDHLESIR